MNLSAWNPISHCAPIILHRKNRREDDSDSNHDTKPKPSSPPDGSARENEDDSRSISRQHAKREFLDATSHAAETFDSPESIPNLHNAFSEFLALHPKYQSSEQIDHLRATEYAHLNPKVCLDYCGFGLFSYLQTLHFRESSAFTVSEVTANITNHALHNIAERNTVEHDIKSAIFDYLNLPKHEYSLLFTVSRGAAFRLLSQAYPFHTNKNLLTMLDYESQSVNIIAQHAKDQGAKASNAWFKYPSLGLCSKDLKRRISSKKRRRKSSAVGLFVFPVQSRVTGGKYSYQWVGLAQKNHWHVLLDAGSLGPKEMDSLGLSLFRPEFIITSFYRVFGYDPTGFGCLLIKNSVMGLLKNQCGSIMRIKPDYPVYLTDSDDVERLALGGNGDTAVGLPAFSGVFEVFEDDGKSPAFEEPVISEDESSDTSCWIGESPATQWFANDRHVLVNPLYDEKSTILSFDQAILSEQTKDRAIRRETEGEFRLLGRRVSFDGGCSGRESHAPGSASSEGEPEIVCRHLRHADSLGLNRITTRHRFLVNWLVRSLLRLRVNERVNLVEIYGPKVKYERGNSVSFNVRDGRNGGFLKAETVQKLAEGEGIFVGIGFLRNVRLEKGDAAPFSGKIEVVTASLGFLTNFDDVYKLWAFVAQFLGPVCSEVGRG